MIATAVAAHAIPVSSSISPTSATAGASAVTLNVYGTGFGVKSKVRWNGAQLATTFVAPTHMRATVPATDLATAGTAKVTIINWNGIISNALTFTISAKTSTATLAIMTSGLPSATAGTAYNATMQASGGSSPYAWSLSSGQLPAGLSLSSNGVVSGTPTTSGTSTFMVGLKDSASQSTTRSESITVAAKAPAALSITTSTLPGATVGTGYSVSLAATGGVAPYSWRIASGALPAGMSLSTSGVISGTPTTAGASTFSVTAKDSATSPQAATQTFGISVVASNAITPPPQAAGYNLMFQDDFTSLDLSSTGTGNHNWYNPGIWWENPAPSANITAANSILNLNWTRGQATDDTSIATSAKDASYYKAWRYGYYEVRMKWNTTTGAWPAIWLLPVQGITNPSAEHGEIDIFEGQGATPNMFYGTIHDWSGSTDLHNNAGANYYQFSSTVDLSQYHTYGILWVPGHITWYFDNQPIISAATFPIFDQQNYYLIIGAQEGVNWTYGNLSGVTANTMSMNVDWVRVWQK